MDELIRKSDAVKAINSWLYCDEDERMPDEVIKALPPVQPEILASGEGELNVPDMNDGDMISRQVAMEMLMAQNVIMDGSEYHNGFNAGVNRAQKVIRNLPTVQLNHNADVSKMEIIHCKDCKYWKEKPSYTYCEKMYRMGIIDVLDYATEENDFCSMAEKRGEESEQGH